MKTSRRSFLQLLGKGLAASVAVGITTNDDQDVEEGVWVEGAPVSVDEYATVTAFSTGGSWDEVATTAAPFPMKRVGHSAIETSRKRLMREIDEAERG